MFNKFITTGLLVVASLAFMPTSHAEHHGMKKDIVDVAAANGSFNTLVAAVKAGGLVDTLKGKGIMADVKASNGVIHVIDTVLMPK